MEGETKKPTWKPLRNLFKCVKSARMSVRMSGWQIIHTRLTFSDKLAFQENCAKKVGLNSSCQTRIFCFSIKWVKSV